MILQLMIYHRVILIEVCDFQTFFKLIHMTLIYYQRQYYAHIKHLIKKYRNYQSAKKITMKVTGAQVFV